MRSEIAHHPLCRADTTHVACRFSGALAYWRGELGLSCVHVARRLGYASSEAANHVAESERGRHSLSLRRLFLLAILYGRGRSLDLAALYPVFYEKCRRELLANAEVWSEVEKHERHRASR